MGELSIQQQYFPEMTCFGCGPANEKGLRLRSYLEGDDRVVAEFTPWPEHDNGLGYLNDGIIGTVLDCHSAAIVVHEAHRHGWTTEGVALPYVTAGLDLHYRRPTPLGETLALVAELIAGDENEMTAHVWIEWEGKVRAEADALWKSWRPRP